MFVFLSEKKDQFTIIYSKHKTVIMRIFLIISILVSTALARPTARPNSVIYQYIERYALRAINTMHDSGIPASLIIAIAIEESAAGQSEIAIHANNHFGLKYSPKWPYESYTTKGGSQYRRYISVQESYEDFAAVIQRNYKELFVHKRSDYKAWAYALEKTNYCNSSGYAKRLIGIIESHSLYNFDNCILEFK